MRLLGETTNFYDFRWRAAQVLGDMGPQAQPAVQALAQALKDPENFVRFNAAQALGSIGPGANSAISARVGALHENHLAPPSRAVDFGGDWQVCAAAAEALGSIGATTGDVVPGLTEPLESSHAETIIAACRSLAAFGTQAKSAVPALLRLTQHAESNVRSVRFNVGQGPAEGSLGLAGGSPEFAFVGMREPGGDEREQFQQVVLTGGGEHRIALK